MKVLTNIDLNKNEVQNVRLHNVVGDPENLVKGQIWIDTTNGINKVKYYDGTEVITIGAINFETTASNIKMNGTAGVGSLSTVARADHVHPSDTSKVPVTRQINGHLLTSDVTVVKSDLGMYYFTCSTAAATAAKTISTDEINNDNLVSGVRIVVKFTNGSSTSSAITLKVGSTSAKAVYRGSTQFNDGIPTGQLIEFMYDGSYWQLIGFRDTKPISYTAGSYEDLSAGTSGTDNLWKPSTLHDYIASAVAAVDAMRFKGTIGTGGDVTALPTTDVKVGDTYRVITAGTYASQTCEVGDLIIATATTPTWTVAQTNIDGAITSISQGTGISVSGSGSSRTIGLASGVVTAGSKGDTSNQTPSWGGTFKVTSETVDTYGRTTALAEHTVKIPNSTATTSADGLMSSADKIVVDRVTPIYPNVYTNPALTRNSSTGLCVWTINNSSDSYRCTNAIVDIYEVSTNKKVIADIQVDQEAESIVISFVSSSNISANTYFAVVVGVDIEY